MNKEEAVKIFDMVARQGNLPATLDKLVPLSFIGSAAVKFYQAKVKLMDQLGITEAQRKATLEDGQDAGEMLLNIEARIGELYASAPEAPRPGRPGSRGIVPGPTKKDIAPKEDRAAHQRMQSSATIHRNPAAVKAVIKEARENEDIPTKTAVLNKIRADKEEAKRKEYERALKVRKSDNTRQTTADALIYLSKLREVVLILPAKAPKEGWSEGSFAEAKAMVEIIRKRLEEWT